MSQSGRLKAVIAANGAFGNNTGLTGHDGIADMRKYCDPAGMDRRSLLTLIAALPALASTPAAACSFALKSPSFAGLQNQQVQRLFSAWWLRDSERFRELFIQKLMDDGSRMESELADELRRLDPLPTTTFDIFDKMFLDVQKYRKLVLVVNTDAGIFVACSELPNDQDIDADCSDAPVLHLFFVLMQGLNPLSVAHLASVATPEPSKFSIWSDK